MAKAVLIFSTQNADAYERVLKSVTKQETDLNNTLAQTTVKFAQLANPTKTQIDLYAKLAKAEENYARGAVEFAKKAFSAGGATGDDLKQQQAYALAYSNALKNVNGSLEENSRRTRTASEDQRSFAQRLGVSAYSLAFAARGLAEFAGAGREVTGFITALASVHDIPSAILVSFGLLLSGISKKVQELDAVEAKNATTLARSTSSLAEYVKLRQQLRGGKDEINTLPGAIRNVPETLGRIAGNAANRLLDVRGPLTNAEAIKAVQDVLQKSLTEQTNKSRAYEDALYGLTKAGEARTAGMQQQIALMAAEGQSYDKLFTAVANYRKELGLAVEDEREEAGLVTRAVEAYQALGNALRQFNLVISVQEQSQLDLDAAVKQQAGSVLASEETYGRLSQALQALGQVEQGSLANQLAALGQRNEEELAIKRLIPTLLEYHRIQGDNIELNAEGAAKLREEARAMIQAQMARERLTAALQAAAATQASLDALETSHARDLDNLNRQSGPARTDAQGSSTIGENYIEIDRRAGEQRIDMARHTAQALADIERGLNEQRTEAARAYQQRLSDFDEQQEKSRTRIAEQYNQTRQNNEANYQESIKRINEAYSTSLFDIEAKRDARALVAAQYNRDRQIKEAENTRNRQNDEAGKSRDEATESLRESIAEQKRLMERDYQRQLEAIERSGAQQREHLAINNRRQEEEMEIGLRRQREAEARSYARSLQQLNEAYEERKNTLRAQLEAQKVIVQEAMDKLTALGVEGFAKVSKSATDFAKTLSDTATSVVDSLKKMLDPAQFGGLIDSLSNTLKGVTGGSSAPFSGGDTGSGVPTAAEGAYTGASGGLYRLHPNEAVLPLGNMQRTMALLDQYVYPSLYGANMNAPLYNAGANGGNGGGMVHVIIASRLNEGLLQDRIITASQGVVLEIVGRGEAA